MATPSPICASSFARRAENFSDGKISSPRNTGCAVGAAMNAPAASESVTNILATRMDESISPSAVHECQPTLPEEPP